MKFSLSKPCNRMLLLSGQYRLSAVTVLDYNAAFGINM